MNSFKPQFYISLSIKSRVKSNSKYSTYQPTKNPSKPKTQTKHGSIIDHLYIVH